jgi:hypothetical protein
MVDAKLARAQAPRLGVSANGLRESTLQTVREERDTSLWGLYGCAQATALQSSTYAANRSVI